MIARFGTTSLSFPFTLFHIVIALTLFLFASAGLTAGSGDDFQDIVDECDTCHGEGGASEHEEIPVIGGMSAFYLEEQLRAYQKERPCEEIEYPSGPKEGETTDMCKEAEDLTEDQIVRLSEHYAEKPFVPADQAHDSELADTGAKIHQRSCRKCHSEGGSLAFDDAGILAGQWKHYLRESFEQYRKDERWQPEKMKPKMEELSDADVDALIEYYAREGEKRFGKGE